MSESFSDSMNDYINALLTLETNFARTGNPSITEIQWPEFNMENYEAMILNVTPRVKKDYLKNERSFWSKISQV